MLTKLSTLRNRGVSEEGFTLIELIIVVVIIGILSAIAIPIFLNQQKSAIQAGVKSDVRNTNTNVATALAKAPTASAIGGTLAAPTDFTTNGADITLTDGTKTATADVVISDSNTTISVGGTWQGYTIQGTNAGGGEGTSDYEYHFDSRTGEYKEGAAPSAPVTP